MARIVDLFCECGRRQVDVMCAPEDIHECPDCHKGMQQDWWSRRPKAAQWDDTTSVLVHVDPATGDVRYPGSHDAHLKRGYERVYLRSLREVERFEKQHNVRSEMAWFDKGTGRGFDDYLGGKKETA